jgi:hypothetical protein
MSEELPRDGLAAIVKRDCPTCVMTAPEATLPDLGNPPHGREWRND